MSLKYTFGGTASRNFKLKGERDWPLLLYKHHPDTVQVTEGKTEQTNGHDAYKPAHPVSQNTVCNNSHSKKKKKWIVRFLICSLGNRDLKLMKGR